MPVVKSYSYEHQTTKVVPLLGPSNSGKVGQFIPNQYSRASTQHSWCKKDFHENSHPGNSGKYSISNHREIVGNSGNIFFNIKISFKVYLLPCRICRNVENFLYANIYKENVKYGCLQIVCQMNFI